MFARTLRDGGIVFVVILTALMLRVELRSQRPSLPRVAYVLGVSAMVLFAFLARDPFLFIVLWSVQHWSAAMGLTSLAASGGVQAPGTHWQRLLAPINRRGWAVLLVLAVVSTLLLPVMEVEAVSDEYVYADRIFGDAALVAALLALRAGAAGAGLRDRLHPLPAGSRCLPLLLARREAGRPRAAAVMIFSPITGYLGRRAPVIRHQEREDQRSDAALDGVVAVGEHDRHLAADHDPAGNRVRQVLELLGGHVHGIIAAA